MAGRPPSQWNQRLNQQQQQLNNLQQNMNQMNQTVNQMQQMLQAFLAAQQGNANNPANDVDGGNAGVNQEEIGQNVPPPPVVQQPVQQPVQQVQPPQYTVEKFIKNGAKHFKGSVDPMEAENWIKIMQKTFKAIEAPDQHWVRLATCMLEGEAQFWWESAMRNNFVGHEVEDLAWEEFIYVFNQKYYPEHIREQKAREFANLIQGDMTVREYEQQFIQLERFAPGVCPTERARVNKFVWGLRYALKDRIGHLQVQTMAEAVAKACLAEEIRDTQYGPLKKKAKVEEQKKKEGHVNTQPKPEQKKEEHRRPNNNNNKGSNNKGRQNNNNQQQQKENPICNTCNKRHAGECLMATNKCFGCGEAGHFKRDCPKKNAGQAQLGAVNAEDARRNNLVQGMITVHNVSAMLLFDSGCTHSFISHSLVRKLKVKPKPLETPLLVKTPSGEETLVDQQVKSVVLSIQGVQVVWDLVVYHLRGIDVILGMDWLDKNHGVIVCKDRRVYTQPGKKKRLLFQGVELKTVHVLSLMRRQRSSSIRDVRAF